MVGSSRPSTGTLRRPAFFGVLALVSGLIVLVLRQLSSREEMVDPSGRPVGVVSKRGESQYWYQYAHASQLISKGDYAAAEKAYLELAGLEPQSSAPYIGMGSVQSLERNFPMAAANYAKALERDARSVDAWTGLGLVSLQQANYGRAKGHFEKALSIEPDHADAYYGMALSCEGLEEYPEALRCGRKFVELAPESRYASFIKEMLVRVEPRVRSNQGNR